MQITMTANGKNHTVDLSRPLDIAIPVRFDGEQLSAFGAPPARMEAHKAEGFIGDVSQGGSCNCSTYIFTPHCNGTHTECVGHISRERINVCDVMKDSLIPATVITVTPQKALECKESYDPELRKDDLLITRSSLRNTLHNTDLGDEANLALVVRTQPNETEKQTRNYDKQIPPFFSIEAMSYIVELGVKHLLVDMPSVDRLDDEGKLTNHRIFWSVKPGANETQNPSPKTITELIYVPDTVKDGYYLLNLQLAAFMADAAPSHPVLYEVTPE